MLVLLHGFAGTPHAWDAVRAQVKEPALAPAILGHGGPNAGTTFDDEVDRIAALIPEGSVLAGYSLGGRLALGLLLRHPQRIRRAVLFGAHPGLPDEERPARCALDDARAAACELDLSRFLETWDRAPMFSRRTPPSREGLTGDGLALSLRTLGLGRMPSRWGALPTTSVPITWVAGREDPRYVELMGRASQHAGRCVLVDDADHDVVSCAPAFVAALLQEEA